MNKRMNEGKNEKRSQTNQPTDRHSNDLLIVRVNKTRQGGKERVGASEKWAKQVSERVI